MLNSMETAFTEMHIRYREFNHCFHHLTILFVVTNETPLLFMLHSIKIIRFIFILFQMQGVYVEDSKLNLIHKCYKKYPLK